MSAPKPNNDKYDAKWTDLELSWVYVGREKLIPELECIVWKRNHR